jgi:hypothetical protein
MHRGWFLFGGGKENRECTIVFVNFRFDAISY